MTTGGTRSEYGTPQGFSSVADAGGTAADEDKKQLWEMFGKVAEAREKYLSALRKRTALEGDLRIARLRETSAGEDLRKAQDALAGHIGAPAAPVEHKEAAE